MQPSLAPVLSGIRAAIAVQFEVESRFPSVDEIAVADPAAAHLRAAAARLMIDWIAALRPHYGGDRAAVQACVAPQSRRVAGAMAAAVFVAEQVEESVVVLG